MSFENMLVHHVEYYCHTRKKLILQSLYDYIHIHSPHAHNHLPIMPSPGVNIQACGNRNQIMYSEIQKPIDFGYAAATWA